MQLDTAMMIFCGTAAAIAFGWLLWGAVVQNREERAMLRKFRDAAERWDKERRENGAA